MAVNIYYENTMKNCNVKINNIFFEGGLLHLTLITYIQHNITSTSKSRENFTKCGGLPCHKKLPQRVHIHALATAH